MANYNKPLTVSAIKKLKPDESIKDSREYAGLNVSCNKQGVKTFSIGIALQSKIELDV